MKNIISKELTKKQIVLIAKTIKQLTDDLFPAFCDEDVSQFALQQSKIKILCDVLANGFDYSNFNSFEEWFDNLMNLKITKKLD